MDSKELLILVENGLSQNEIAEKLNRSQTNVRYWLKKFNIRTKSRKMLQFKISDEALIDAANSVSCYSELLFKIKANRSGGAFYHYKKRLVKLGFDFSVWPFVGKSAGGKKTGKTRNVLAIQNIVRARRKTLDKFLKDNNIKEECNSCGLVIWKGVKLKLHIHHVNKNPKDSSLDNLEYLCPNCHDIKHNNASLLIS